MSFQNKSFWMPRDAECLTDGDINHDTSSRIEPKRPHQWFMDASETEVFGNKRQAIEAVSDRPMSGIPNGSISPWDNTSNFQAVSGQFADRLFGSETVRTSNLVDRSMPSVGTGNLNMERKGFDNQFGTDPSAGLSMSHTIEDASSRFNYGGINKAKVIQAGGSENGMPVPIGHSYRGNNNISIGNSYNEADNSISLGASYNRREENTVSLGPAFTKTNGDFISTGGHTFNKGDGSFMLMGQNCYKGYDNSSSMSQPFGKGDGSSISMGSRYEKGNGNIMSAGPAYNKGHENFISMGSAASAFNKASENFISIAPSYENGDENIVSYNKGETNTISFGGFENEPETNPSRGTISGYDLMANHPSAQISKATGQDDAVENNIGPTSSSSVVPAVTSKANAASKNKEPKQPKNIPPNNFPSNVKSLLSTCILDGVPVKYVSWSREQNLKGVIKGTGYLCGCNDCKFSKSLNAYEFERHAGCKTKHPNNHIYFENGKTIYAVVQELKCTPQEMLFDVIQNVTGSPINQKNFRNWKASFQAATRELQRIYGKDAVIVPS